MPHFAAFIAANWPVRQRHNAGEPPPSPIIGLQGLLEPQELLELEGLLKPQEFLAAIDSSHPID